MNTGFGVIQVSLRFVTEPPQRQVGYSDVFIDDDVRFTVYRPQVLLPSVWASLLVFAHKTNLLKEPGKRPIDPNDLVEAKRVMRNSP